MLVGGDLKGRLPNHNAESKWYVTQSREGLACNTSQRARR